jgi:membrane fusion protein (multidrug efflux system)
MFKNKSVIFIVVLVVALVAAKLLFFTKDAPVAGAAGPGGPAGGKGTAVNGIIVSQTDLEEGLFAIGTVLANEEVELRPEIAGKVVSIQFKEGTTVQKGTLLVKLNDSDFKAQLAKAESSLKLLNETAERQKKLYELNGISRQEYDEALNRVDAVKSDIQFIKAQIEKTEIRAPFTGQVGLKNISEGSYVGANYLIASMQQLNPLKIDFGIPEKYLSQVKTGKEITFTVDGDEVIHTAKIYAVEPKVETATRTLKMRALAENPGNKIVPGSFARVKFSLSRTGQAILIPTQAIIPILKGKKVMVARNGMALSLNIVTGIRKNKEVEVVSGLNPGDTVITSGIMSLRDSMKVSVRVFD